MINDRYADEGYGKEDKMMERKMRTGRTNRVTGPEVAELAGLMVITALLVLVIAFCVTKTVFSQDRVSERQWENYCRVQEKEMVQQVRTYLNENGYKNSGVMLTRIVDESGKCEYTLTVHHGKIDKLDDDERELLKKELSVFDFATEDCKFYHEFLVTD